MISPSVVLMSAILLRRASFRRWSRGDRKSPEDREEDKVEENGGEEEEGQPLAGEVSESDKAAWFKMGGRVETGDRTGEKRDEREKNP